MSLGASDCMLKKLSAIYWWTIEFGMIKEAGRMKFYGGGIAGSVTEIKHAISCGNYFPLNLQEVSTNFVLEDLQSYYYYIQE